MTARLARHSLRAIARHRMRSAFIMLGSFIGTAALTLVIAAGEGAERKVLTTVRQLFGASSIMVVTGGGQLMGGARADAARLTMDDLDAIAEALPHVAAWDPQQALRDASIRHGGATANARVLGASEQYAQVWERGVARGELFDAGAVKSSARVALIGEMAARELFGEADPVGAEVLVGNVPFRIIGVLEPFGIDVHGMDRDDEVVVPISTLMRRVMNVDTIAAAKLIVDDPANVAATVSGVRRVLRERHAIGAHQPDDFTIISAVAVQKMVARTQRILALWLPLGAALVLLAGGIVAASLMLASVNERVAEIGLRRAVGARVEDIQSQFLLETAATTVLGGLLGITLGYGLALVAASRLHLGALTPWRAAIAGILVSLVVGLVAGVIPARRAARLDPATALR